jgi:hypothetical protein
MKLLAILAVALASSTSATAVSAVEDAASDGAPADLRVAPERISIASYDGDTIDLRNGWGTATACYVDAWADTTCFASEAEMDAFIDAAGPPKSFGLRRSARAVCGSTLRLYDGISYTSGVVAFSLRGTVIDLSSVGFDNATTSYKVGACSSTLYAGAGATGGAYPGNTTAGAQSPNMVGGWNNVISSIFIP